MSTTIRIATPSDVAAIENCARLAYQHYIERMQQTPAPMVANFRQQVIDGIVWVAEQDSMVVGYIVYFAQSHGMHLENVAVLPAHNGKGIGKQLITHVEQQAIANNLPRIELYTNELMHENIEMYARLGYVETERKAQSGFRRVFFEKILRPNNT